MYKSFITRLTHTSIGNTSKRFSVENSKIQSATFGPTPGNVKSSSLTFNVSFSACNFSKLISLFNIFLVVSYTRTSLKPKPKLRKSFTSAFDNCSGVGNV